MTTGRFENITLGAGLSGTDNGDGSITVDVTAGSGIPTDGWVAATAWTYASASTFTVSGDLTSTFKSGVRLKFTQTTVKYGVVKSSVHAAGTTTVTIIVNTDYVLANAAITDPYYSPVLAPAGYPGWFNYAVAATGFSGTPTTSGRFQVENGWCHVCVTIDGTSNATTFGCVLPVAAVQGGPLWVANAYVGTALTAPSAVQLTSGSATLALLRTWNSAANTWANSGGKGAYFEGSYPFS